MFIDEEIYNWTVDVNMKDLKLFLKENQFDNYLSNIQKRSNYNYGDYFVLTYENKPSFCEMLDDKNQLFLGDFGLLDKKNTNFEPVKDRIVPFYGVNLDFYNKYIKFMFNKFMRKKKPIKINGKTYLHSLMFELERGINYLEQLKIGIKSNNLDNQTIKEVNKDLNGLLLKNLKKENSVNDEILIDQCDLVLSNIDNNLNILEKVVTNIEEEFFVDSNKDCII